MAAPRSAARRPASCDAPRLEWMLSILGASAMNPPLDAAAQPLVLAETRDGICTLTMNRGDRFNALSTAMIGALDAALDAVAADAPGARGGAGGRRPGVLRRSRPDRDARAHRRDVAAGPVRRLHRHDAEAHAHSAAGDRARARRGGRGGLPARLDVRPRGGGGPRASSACPASTPASSARRPQWAWRATCRASARWSSCSPAS